MSHQKITKAHRLNYLRNALQNHPITLVEMVNLYSSYHVKRSLRQVQRDLKELENYIEDNEKLHAFFVHKIKYYALEKVSVSRTAKDYITPTNFYEPLQTLHDEQKKNVIQKALAKGKRITISKIINDETGDNAFFETKQIELVPLQLLYHRNNYYLGGFHVKRQCGVCFNIKQLVSVELLEKDGAQEHYRLAYTKELASRFGVTKNIDQQIYDIKIEIANVLITFIKNHHWHHSQKITKEKNRNYLHLTCGINRELVGWLCQWMYNIKIIHPPILKEYYKNTLFRMQQNNEKNLPLVYRNLFNNEEEETTITAFTQ